MTLLSVRLHKVLGYTALLPATYMSITGIASGLAEELEHIVEPQLFSVEPVIGSALSRKEIDTAIRDILGDVAYQIAPRQGVFDTLQVSYWRDGLEYQSRVMWINPYTGKLLADKAQSERLSAIIKRFHNGSVFGSRLLAVIMSALVLGACISSLGSFWNYSKGKHFWHIQLSLVAIPVIVLLTVSGIVGYWYSDNWLFMLHTGKNTIARLVIVVCVCIFIASLIALLRSSRSIRRRM